MCDQFAQQKDTWTKKSSLTMSNWDPYPELQGGCEPFSYGNTALSYPQNKTKGPSPYTESYTGKKGCVRYTHESLGDTWLAQFRYDLN